MNEYEVTFNRSGEVSKFHVEAKDSYQAILIGCGIMAKKYGVGRDSMIRYFTADKLNCEAKKAA